MALEVLERIRIHIQKNAMTSPNLETHKCKECQDTGWIETSRNKYVECKCVDLKFIKSCWENYGVKPEEVKPLREYNPYNKISALAKSKAANYITNFKEMRNQRNNWFGLFGQPGAGKTFIAIAMGAALLTRGEKPVKVVYMPYLEVMRELKANTLDDEYYIKLLNRYHRAEVLIIDDLFKDKVRKGKLAYDLTEADTRHFYPILNYRYYNRLPTLISSECTPRMLTELDGALGGRILEMCDENITVFVGEEFNYRLKKFERG